MDRTSCSPPGASSTGPRVRPLAGPRTCVDGPRLARTFRVSGPQVACGHVSGLSSRHRPQALMGSVDRGLIRLAGSRCPMSSDRSPSIRRSTDDAITLLHPRKSCGCVGQVQQFDYDVSRGRSRAADRSPAAPRGRVRQWLAAFPPAPTRRGWPAEPAPAQAGVVQPGTVFVLQVDQGRNRCRPAFGPRRGAPQRRCGRRVVLPADPGTAARLALGWGHRYGANTTSGHALTPAAIVTVTFAN